MHDGSSLFRRVNRRERGSCARAASRSRCTRCVSVSQRASGTTTRITTTHRRRRRRPRRCGRTRLSRVMSSRARAPEERRSSKIREIHGNPLRRSHIARNKGTGRRGEHTYSLPDAINCKQIRCKDIAREIDCQPTRETNVLRRPVLQISCCRAVDFFVLRANTKNRATNSLLFPESIMFR